MFFPYMYYFPPSPQHTERSRRKTQRQTLGETVTKWVYMFSLHVLSQVWYLSVANLSGDVFFRRGNGLLQSEDGNSRHASVSEEEENLAVLRRWGISHGPFICNQITRHMDREKSYPLYLFSPGPNHSFDPSFCLYALSVCRHVMNELLETERAYVEELLCVLQVGISSLNSYSLFFTSARKLIFCFWCVYRDMLLRWIIQRWFTSCLLLCRTKRRFCLATCQKSTTSTEGEGAPSACHWWY